MRIPTSSSILLATLAISSSSTCLAAPTGDAPQGSISTTNSHISSMHSSGVPRAEGMPIYERDESNTQYMQARSDPLVSLIGSVPLVGPALVKALAPILAAVGTATAQSVDPQDLDDLQNAVAQMTHALNGTLSNLPLPDPVKEVPGTVISKTPLGAESDNDASGPNANTDPGSADASMSSSAPAVADNGSASSSTSASYTSVAASPSASPPMPANPPNTPSPPVHPPSLPINA